MRELVTHLSNGKHLTPRQIIEAAAFLVDLGPTAETKAAFLQALSNKGETPDEIAGFVNEFLKLAVEPGIYPDKL
ncbi:MAG: anthranilate phosphoribosyltransferase, partial [Verrucomicrobiaceae bacterium]|nr:anthranilate phosphoribosyltransferase [Verrucomicrobiaceae bacterium]